VFYFKATTSETKIKLGLLQLLKEFRELFQNYFGDFERVGKCSHELQQASEIILFHM